MREFWREPDELEFARREELRRMAKEAIADLKGRLKSDVRNFLHLKSPIEKLMRTKVRDTELSREAGEFYQQLIPKGLRKPTSEKETVWVRPNVSKEDEKVPIESEKLQGALELFESEERDAWAHAVRTMRFLRELGFDIEPGLKTVDEVEAYVKPCLKTYEQVHLRQVELNRHRLPFTRDKKAA